MYFRIYYICFQRCFKCWENNSHGSGSGYENLTSWVIKSKAEDLVKYTKANFKAQVGHLTFYDALSKEFHYHKLYYKIITCLDLVEDTKRKHSESMLWAQELHWRGSSTKQQIHEEVLPLRLLLKHCYERHCGPKLKARFVTCLAIKLHSFKSLKAWQKQCTRLKISPLKQRQSTLILITPQKL